MSPTRPEPEPVLTSIWRKSAGSRQDLASEAAVHERSVLAEPGGVRLRAVQEDVEIGGWLALVIFGSLLLTGRSSDLLPSSARLILLLAWPIVSVVFAWSRRPAAVVIYCLVGGLLLRWVGFWPGGGGSDVLLVTNEWLRTIGDGGNPYDHFYLSSIPPGSPVPYPPVQFLAHLPGYIAGGLVGVRFTEVAASLGVMLTFAALAWRGAWSTALPALALYAGLSNLIELSVDGSNDTGSGAVLLLAVLGTWWATTHDFDDRSARIAGLTSALALGMKQTTLFVVLMLAAYIWRRGGRAAFTQYAFSVVVLLGVVSAVFLAWNPIAYLLALASLGGIHANVYGWNVWALLGQIGVPVIGQADGIVLEIVVAFVAMAAALLLPLRRIGPTLVAGIVVTLLVLFVARWTTHAYFAILAPILLAIPILVTLERRQEASQAGRPVPDSV